MAFRSPVYNCLRKIVTMPELRRNAAVNGGTAKYATAATTPKMKAYTPAIDYAKAGAGAGQSKLKGKVKGDFVPVCVALGLILLSVGFGLHTAKQHLFYSPMVYVKKSRRETLPELEEPDKTLEEADKFIKKSLFRKVAHVQEFDVPGAVVPDHIRGDVLARQPRAETLKSVGVDPKLPK